MSTITIKGKLKVINPTVQVSEKFAKREFVIETTTEMYPQSIAVQLSQDKCNLLDGLFVGQEVDVDVNLRGREWTSPQGEVKYFNTIEAWRITPLAVANVPVQKSIPVQQLAPVNEAMEMPSDLPF
jgi:hypothetical protein